jgi:predicted amidohydrolase YtcJ
VSPWANTPAELVVTAATIRTFDERAGDVEALGIADGVVVAVGTREEVERRSRPEASRLELPGAVLPGFCDTHMHFEKIAAELQMVQLGGARSVAEVLDLVAAATGTRAPGEWIQSFGDDNAWHEERLLEERLPERSELDDVAPDHPVYLYRGQDAAALNSAAVDALAAVLQANAGWDPHRGQLRSPLARVLQEGLPQPSDQPATLEAAARTLLGFGITTIVDPGLPAAFETTWDLYCRCQNERRIPQRLYLMDRLDHRRGFDEELHRVSLRHVWPTAATDGVQGWGLKLLVDGEFANAWMREGEPQPVPATVRYSGAQLRTALEMCAEKGWPVCFHVMGGGAIDAVIEAVRDTGGASSFSRSQVSLAHAFLPSEHNLAECAELGIALSVHPLLAYVFENEMVSAWGARAHLANPFRTMLDAGVDLSGGSDVLPCEPLRGAALAVTRTSRLGTRLGIAQALTPNDAIALFTGRAGIYVQQPELGTLAVGAPADLVCWPDDPFTRRVDEWSALRPALVVIGGTVVLRDDLVAPSAMTCERSST